MMTGLPKRIKILRTVALYLSFFALGLCAAIPGPTLIDLQQIVHIDVSRVTFIYLARSSGYVVGSLVGGAVFDIIERKQLILIATNLIMGITVLATPWCRGFEIMVGILAICGLSMGALDTGGNVLCLNLWGKEGAPFYQALHFLFGVGAFLAPLVAAPFLYKPCDNNTYWHDLNATSSIPSSYLNSTNDISVISCDRSDAIPPVTYSYSIIGGFTLLETLFFVALYFIYPHESSIDNTDAEEQKPKVSLGFTAVVVILCQQLFGVYCGIEIGFGQMLATFAVKGSLHLSKETASYITAVYWGTFTFARGLSVFLSYKLPPFYIVLMDLILTLAGTGILVTFGNSRADMLWAGTTIMAVGMSSIFPSTISWIDRYINVTNKIASLFVIFAALGEMVIPLVVSQFIATQPLMLMYIITGCAIACCIYTVALWIVMNRKGEKYVKTVDDNGTQRHSREQSFVTECVM